MGSCPGLPNGMSCAEFDQHTVYLDWMDRDTLAHELGHLWDMQHMTDAARARWNWRPGSWYFQSVEDISSLRVPGGEAFADAYVMCSHSYRWRKFNRIGLYGERIPKIKVAVVCWLLRHPPVP